MRSPITDVQHFDTYFCFQGGCVKGWFWLLMDDLSLLYTCRSQIIEIRDGAESLSKAAIDSKLLS